MPPNMSAMQVIALRLARFAGFAGSAGFAGFAWFRVEGLCFTVSGLGFRVLWFRF